MAEYTLVLPDFFEIRKPTLSSRFNSRWRLPGSSLTSLDNPRTCALKSGYLAYTIIIFRLTREVINVSNMAPNVVYITIRLEALLIKYIPDSSTILTYMHYYDVLVATKQRVSNLFTYASAQEVPLHKVVVVPFKNQVLKGLIIAQAEKYPGAKMITRVTTHSLPPELVRASFKLADLSSMSKSGLAQLLLSNVTPITLEEQTTKHEKSKTVKLPMLTPDQSKVLDGIRSSSKPQLLFGITGSGKTRIYTELAKQQLRAAKSVLILSPEIGLSQQALEVLKQSIAHSIYSLHSRMTVKQRRQTWWKISNSVNPVVVVGPRSALFLPIHKLGLIVIDEFHDDSYKQSNEPRYHSLHISSCLAKEHKSLLLCGSATPNVTDYYHFERAGYPIHVLDKKALPDATRPQLVVIDQTKEPQTTELLSKTAQEHIKATLDQQNQVLVFYNRRGTSRLAQCATCGWVDMCPACDANLVLHQDQSKSICHYCNRKSQPQSVCPICSTTISYTMPGIQQLAHELKHRFPDATVLRFDSDNKRPESLVELSSSLDDRKKTIILGTQIISKGLDLPLLQAVIIVRADQSLGSADYRAEEKYFQQITQLIGRVGRGHLNKTSVVIQTFRPDYWVLACAIQENWPEFYRQELRHRSKLGFPPFKYIASIRIKRKTQRGCIKASERLVDTIQASFGDLEILGPAPAMIEKQHNNYIWMIHIFSKSRSRLVELADEVGQSEYIDMDPVQLF